MRFTPLWGRANIKRLFFNLGSLTKLLKPQTARSALECLKSKGETSNEKFIAK